jgi:arginine decarboxylase
VYTMAEACREFELPMPDLISESGRALTAHHALLLLKVIDVDTNTVPDMPELTDDDHLVLHEMREDWVEVHAGKELKPRKVREIAHDASFDKDRARQYFAADALDLRQLAVAEQLHLGIMNGLQRLVRQDPEEFEDILPEIEASLTDRYFCNFSLFQSLPDHWAIDQLFPVMPIHRLDEQPDRMGTLQDVTCDSDGKISSFVGDRNGRPALELHATNDDDYILGIFLTGAYQEILGDLHNLFGDTNAVHVNLDADGRYAINDIVHGDTVTEVLNYVQFHAPNLLATFRRKVQNSSAITRTEANTFIAEYVAGLEGYTYLEGEAAR